MLDPDPDLDLDLDLELDPTLVLEGLTRREHQQGGTRIVRQGTTWCKRAQVATQEFEFSLGNRAIRSRSSNLRGEFPKARGVRATLDARPSCLDLGYFHAQVYPRAPSKRHKVYVELLERHTSTKTTCS